MPSTSAGSSITKEYNDKHDHKPMIIRCTRRQYRLIINSLWTAYLDLFYDKERDKKMSSLNILYEFNHHEAWDLHDRLENHLSMIEKMDKEKTF